jgi:predicted ATPase
MSRGHQHFRMLAFEDWSWFEETIDRFVNDWRRGHRPGFEDYLPTDARLRHPLLIELAHTELELRVKAGEPVRVEEYLAHYPQLTADPDCAVELIAAEYQLRRAGEPGLTPGDYLQRFPQYRAQLPERLARETLAAPPAAPAPEQSEAAVPEVAGYEVLAPLGRGGMGVVYKARQLSLNRLVALKFLPAECAGDPAWLQRFRSEGRTASALNHPHICTIYDSGQSAGRPFLSMELIEGRTLKNLAERRPCIAELARLVGQAARALAAAHAAGVVHRDVKPENLMVRDDGIVKVLDFGLARQLPTDGGRGSEPGGFLGTPLYMAPEQARGEPMGTAGDVFALGLVLYELATGQHPFLAESELGVLHAIATVTPPPPSRLNPEVPAELDALVQQMLAKDARLRPTAAEVAEALARLGEHAPGAAGAPAPGAARPPTVGRAGELAALHAGFESAASGRGLMLCVTGEPGLGKTTLVEDFLAELGAGGHPFRLARARCSERLAGAEAYLPFLEALDGLLQGADGSSAARVMKLVAPAWYVRLAPLAAEDPALAGVLTEARAASQERLKRELSLFLEEVSRPRPVVLFLDDIHWADPSSLDLLAYLGGRCAALSLLLVVTYRPADLLLGGQRFGPVQLELQGRGLCREIALPSLSRDDFDRYLALTFPGHRFPEEFAAAAYARAGGNPLFMADLLRYLRDRGTLVARDGSWELTEAVPDLLRELPESIRSLIRRKLEQLGGEDRRLLMAASVQGPEFDSAVAARLLGRGADEVEERLDALERVHGLVRLVREHEFPDGALSLRYGFVHGLYQNALYAGLRPTRRASWSAAAAQALLEHWGDKSAAAATELALLFEAAREPARAVDYFLQAARNALRVPAHREAAALARHGLTVLCRQPDTAARAARELPLLLALGVSLVATRGFAAPEVEEVYDRARVLGERAGDVAGLFPVLYGLWNCYLVRAELTRCDALARQMFSLAQERPDLERLLVAHNVCQQPLFHRGELASARGHQERGLALYDPPKHRALTSVYGEDPGVGCLAYGAVTLWHRGYPEQALQSARAARRLAEELADPFNVAQALYYGTCAHLCRREAGPAQELARALADVCHEQGFALLSAGASVLHGWALARQGQAAGIGEMRRGLDGWRATGAVSHRPFHLGLLAEALLGDGRAEEAVAALDEALPLSAATGERFWEAELHRLRGESVLARGGAGEEVAAEESFRRALGLAREQRARSLELRAAVSLSRHCRGPGLADEARQTLADVCGWFTEGFDTPDLQAARAALAAPA